MDELASQRMTNAWVCHNCQFDTMLRLANALWRTDDLCMTKHYMNCAWRCHNVATMLRQAKEWRRPCCYAWPVHDDVITETGKKRHDKDVCYNKVPDLCMTMHWLGWSRLAMSSSLMIILETSAWTEFTSSSNMSARIGCTQEETIIF